jgi:hypothetical protein
MGWVVPVRLKKPDKVIFVCSESEETWLEERDIMPGAWAVTPTQGHYSYLNSVMESYGLSSTDYEQLEWLDVED